MARVIVDPELNRLIPALAPQERAQLEASLLAAGCRDALVLWDGTLLDGHNRYEICERLGLPYDTVEVDLDDRDEAKVWIINNQLGRRNLQPFQKVELGIVLEPIIAARAKENQRQSMGAGAKGRQKSDNLSEVDTLQQVADLVGVSRDTYSRGKKIQGQADDATKTKLRDGATTINREYQKIRQGERRKQKVEQLSSPEPVNSGRFAPVPLILADPPWRYEFAETDSRRIENHYPTMSLEEICALPVGDIATPDALLFMWATSPKVWEACSVIDAWGFTYRTSMVWVKDRIGMGYWARQRHELILVASRGSPPAPEPSARPDSVIEAPRREHSRKPDALYEILEAMYPEWDGRRVELFARRPRPGWLPWGNEA